MSETQTDSSPRTTAPTQRFTLSDSAVRRVAELLAQDPTPGQMLRVSVSGGGCAGFQYGFDFDATRNDDDLVIERDGARVVIDSVSLDLLAGSELNFVEDLVGSYFAINNPNATSSCGCGTSFSM